MHDNDSAQIKVRVGASYDYLFVWFRIDLSVNFMNVTLYHNYRIEFNMNWIESIDLWPSQQNNDSGKKI